MAEQQRLNVDEPGNLAKELKEFLFERIKGQERAVKELASTLDLFQAGFREAGRPICAVLFLGPSGVGKTLAAEVLAEFFFDSRNAFTKIACSEYQEPHTISSLRGSPPGYVGYYDPEDSYYNGTEPILSQANVDRHDYEYQRRTNKECLEAKEKISILLKEQQELEKEKARLEHDTEQKSRKYQDINIQLNKIRNEVSELFKRYLLYSPQKNYRSIVLFDEVEKASDALHRLLLEILDKGKLTLANGNLTNFSNSFIILTSNVGSKKIADILNAKQIGFQVASERGDNLLVDDLIYQESIKEAGKVFPPEFLGRLDTKIVFRPLGRENLKEILEIHIQDFLCLLVKNKQSVVLKIEEAVKEFILREATDRLEYGARLLKNKVQKHLKEPLSRLVNKGELKSGDVVRICLENNGKKKITFYRETF